MRSGGLDQLERETFWRTHVDACQQHPGRQRDYCQQHGLVARELRKWRTHFYRPLRQQAVREDSEGLPEEGSREFSYARPPGKHPGRRGAARHSTTVDDRAEMATDLGGAQLGTAVVALCPPARHNAKCRIPLATRVRASGADGATTRSGACVRRGSDRGASASCADRDVRVSADRDRTDGRSAHPRGRHR